MMPMPLSGPFVSVNEPGLSVNSFLPEPISGFAIFTPTGGFDHQESVVLMIEIGDPNVERGFETTIGEKPCNPKLT